MTPLERAARALCEAQSDDPDNIVCMISGPPRPHWEAMLPRARAVLEALSVSSEAMEAEGVKADEENEHQSPARAVRNIWDAMISAALEEGPK